MEVIRPFGIEERKGHYNEEAIYSLAHIYGIIYDQLAEFLSPYNLTPGKFNILMVIKHKSTELGIKQVDVSKNLIVTPSNMTKLIDKLENEKLVARFALDGDRRVNMIKITDKGSKLLDSLWDQYCRKMQEFSKGLSMTEQKQISLLLSKWLTYINQ